MSKQGSARWSASLGSNEDDNKELKRMMIDTEPWDAFKANSLQEKFNLPLEEILKMRALFDKYDRNKDGILEASEFQLSVRSILKELYPSAKEVPRKLFESESMDRDGRFNFYEFLRWLSKHSFTEIFLLSPEQQRLRSVARKWGMTISDVEHIKKKFDDHDLNATGTIEYFEFRRLMLSLLKVPAEVEFPENRVKAFWQEVDSDADGVVEFEEFLGWYRRYFGMAGNSDGGNTQGDMALTAMKRFYGSVRAASAVMHNM